MTANVPHQKDVIERPSQKTLYRALTTFPLSPIYVAACFSLETENTVGGDYLVECREKGIIPGSSISFRASEQDLVVDEFRARRGIESFRGIVSGHRPQEVTFELTGFSGHDAFPTFKDSAVPKLRENGYILQRFDIWLTCLGHGSNESKWETREDGLYFREEEKLILETGSESDSFDSQKAAQIRRWFDSLKNHPKSS